MDDDIEKTVTRKHPLALCETCPLYGKGHYVPTRFPANGNGLAIVGESPGRKEWLEGEPFVGPSGQVMAAVLRHNDLDIEPVLKTNSLACHYFEKDFAKPPPAAIEACRPRLLDELREGKVETVISVGAVAAKSLLTSRKGITKLRGGPPRPSDYAPDVMVIPTFHPAAAMRDESKLQYIDGDVAKYWTIGEKYGTWSDPDYVVVDDPDHAMEIIDQYLCSSSYEAIVLDTESGAEKDETFGNVGLQEVLCMGFYGYLHDTVFVLTRAAMTPDIRRMLRALLERNGVVGQNLKYDVGELNVFLESESIFPVFDTMIASYTMNEHPGVHGLEYMGMEYLGAPAWKTEFKERHVVKGDYNVEDKSALYEYNARDVWATYCLWNMFESRMDERAQRLHDWLLVAGTWVGRMEARGFAVDKGLNFELEQEFDSLMSAIEWGYVDEDEIDINPNSHVQVRALLERFGVEVPNTRKETIGELIEYMETLGRNDIVQFCKALLEYKGYSKLKSTFVVGVRKKIQDDNFIVHPSFLLHGTTTGRLSCRAPNLQNIPRGSAMRRQFIARDPRNVLIQCDYGQAELRVLTWFGKDENMQAIFNDPTQDPFAALTKSLFGEQAFRDANKAELKEMRTMTKTFAYGVAYGRGAGAVAKAFNLDFEVAQQKLEEFYALIPGIMDFQRKVKAQAMRGEPLLTPFGRRRRFQLITNMNRHSIENEACAFMPQSTASDICLTAFIQLSKDGLAVVNSVHDAILVECPEDEAVETARHMRDVMVGIGEDVTEHYVPFKVDAEVGYSWGTLQDMEL
jgi:uracil-DNA glycosylase family 4